MYAVLAYRRIHDQLDLLIGDQVQDIRTAFVQLVYLLCLDAVFFDQFKGGSGCQDLESGFLKCLCHFHDFRLILAIYGDQYGTFQRQICICAFFCLVECACQRLGDTQHFTGGTHFRPEDRVYFLEHIEREYRFFYAVIRDGSFGQFRYRGLASGQLGSDDIGCQRHHTDTTDLRYQRHGTGCAGICFQHIYLTVLDRILHVHKTYHMHLFGDLSGVFLDGCQLLVRDVLGRDHTCRVTGVDTCQLNVLHNRRYISVGTVADGICLALQSMI